MEAKEAIREQIIGALKGASFPLETRNIIKCIPEWSTNYCQYNVVTIKAVMREKFSLQRFSSILRKWC